MRNLVKMLPLFLLVVPSASSFAWGPEGHTIVAEIAQRNLTKATKTELKKLLPEDATLADVANWADTIRPFRKETAPWHFVDIQRDVDTYDAARDCKQDDCVVAQIDRLVAVLKDKKAAKKARTEALKFVVHFVGDLHQPLHATDDHDRGGNSKKVKVDLDVYFVKPAKNLHGVWDGDLIEAHEGSEAKYIGALAALTSEEKADLRRGTVFEWVNESHKEGRTTAYGLLPQPNGGTYTLTDEYFEAGMTVVDTQLQRAGIRLARLLNEALGGAKPPP